MEHLITVLDQVSSPVRIWWRDDDAGCAHPNFARLLAVANRVRVPVALGVVPHWLELDVVERIRTADMATVVQHGWSHNDNALKGGHPIEIGGSPSPSTLKSQLAQGRSRLERTFGRKFVSLLVPPWNLIDESCVGMVDELGFDAVSAAPHNAIPGLRTRRFDAQIDFVYWYPFLRHLPWGMSLVGWFYRCHSADTVAEKIVARIEADRVSPIGLVTHHRLMGADDFAALEQLLRVVRDHPNARWLSAHEVVTNAGHQQVPARSRVRPREPASGH